MPQCFGETPCTTTWMCSGAAPLDSASAFVRLSMIFGTDSSVTRLSYSFTSIQGMSALLLPQNESDDDSDRQEQLQACRDAALPVPALDPVRRKQLRVLVAGVRDHVLEVGCCGER